MSAGRAGRAGSGLGALTPLRMSHLEQVRELHPQAFAAPFNSSRLWYVCNGPGGSIIGKGDSEAADWADAVRHRRTNLIPFPGSYGTSTRARGVR